MIAKYFEKLNKTIAWQDIRLLIVTICLFGLSYYADLQMQSRHTEYLMKIMRNLMYMAGLAAISKKVPRMFTICWVCIMIIALFTLCLILYFLAITGILSLLMEWIAAFFNGVIMFIDNFII